LVFVCSTLFGVASSIVVVAEQVQLAHMIWGSRLDAFERPVNPL
jgi:hypothetical protein